MIILRALAVAIDVFLMACSLIVLLTDNRDIKPFIFVMVFAALNAFAICYAV